MSRPSRAELLERAAVRLAANHRFVASLLAAWSGGNVDLKRVALTLNCDVAAVTRLALCFRPRSTSEDFGKDIAEIATRTGVAEAHLMTFLREAESLAAFRRGAAAEEGVLAAARDGKIDDAIGEDGE
jgi:hypothetical protein